MKILYYITKLRKEKDMFSFFTEILQKNAIDCFAPIPLSSCRILRPYLLEREGIKDGTVILMAVPYLTAAATAPDRNLSAYAVSRDYHGFFAELFDSLLPLLRKKFPEHRFAGFADHSPIAEVEAAARAGLGVIGENGLLITERYSSYVFLGEIVTDAHIDCNVGEIGTCEGCGACRRACPMHTLGTCLSALTQKKGDLTADEQEAILKYGSVWGCDICQEVCPHTRSALESGSILSPVPYFGESSIPHLTTSILDSLSDADFRARAFAWRGRDTVRRNLALFEKNQ